MSNPSLAWNKAYVFKINGDDDDDDSSVTWYVVMQEENWRAPIQFIVHEKNIVKLHSSSIQPLHTYVRKLQKFCVIFEDSVLDSWLWSDFYTSHMQVPMELYLGPNLGISTNDHLLLILGVFCSFKKADNHLM